MTRTDPVTILLTCEAREGDHTIEYDRDQWNAMTPTQRAVMLDNEVDTHIANQGGAGWYIADPDDEASVGTPPAKASLPLADNPGVVETVGRWLADPNRPAGDVYTSARDLLARIDAALTGKE